MKNFLLSYIVTFISILALWLLTNNEWFAVIVGPIVSIWVTSLYND